MPCEALMVAGRQHGRRPPAFFTFENDTRKLIKFPYSGGNMCSIYLQCVSVRTQCQTYNTMLMRRIRAILFLVSFCFPSRDQAVRTLAMRRALAHNVTTRWNECVQLYRHRSRFRLVDFSCCCCWRWWEARRVTFRHQTATPIVVCRVQPIIEIVVGTIWRSIFGDAPWIWNSASKTKIWKACD